MSCPPPPRIACFHGGGSTGEIFKVQCRSLQNLLQPGLEFVFFDAPFERSAGPGILPAFEDYAPFKTWFTKDDDGIERSDGSGYYEGRSEGGITRVLEMMEAEGEGGEWVGAMGFSQGTRVVGGLLLQQQRRREQGKTPRSIHFRFGVLCMGGGEPMLSDPSEGKPPTLHALRCYR
jgi:hypothetical protein